MIAEYPKKLGITQFTLSEILDAASPDELLIKAGELYLNKVMYKKPLEYLRDINPTASGLDSLVERSRLFSRADPLGFAAVVDRRIEREGDDAGHFAIMKEKMAHPTRK